jgi:hypothetical protein
MNKLHYPFHFFAYYISWIACLLLAARGMGGLAGLVVLIFVAAQIVWQYTVRKDTSGLFLLIVLLTLVGSLVDSLFVAGGLVIFASNPFAPYFTAPWMISLWISLSVLFFSTLSNLFTRYVLLGLLSWAGFAAAYAAGARMGAAIFPLGYVTCFLVGLVWAILLPLLIVFYQRILQKSRS